MVYRYNKVTSLSEVLEVGDTELFMLRSVYYNAHMGEPPDYDLFAKEGIALGTHDYPPNIGLLIELLEAGNLFTRTEVKPAKKPHIRRINPETGRGGRISLGRGE